MNHRGSNVGRGICSCLFADAIANTGERSVLGVLKTIVTHRGFHALLSHRIQHAFAKVPVLRTLIAMPLWYVTSSVYRNDISPDAILYPGVRIPDPRGVVVTANVVIGPDAALGRNVTVYCDGPRPICIFERVTIGERAVVQGSGIEIEAASHITPGSVIDGGASTNVRPSPGAHPQK